MLVALAKNSIILKDLATIKQPTTTMVFAWNLKTKETGQEDTLVANTMNLMPL